MFLHWAIYLLGGLLSGSVNAVAGGGALFLFPLLIGLGLPPMIANTTMSLIVQPGTLSAAIGYRHQLRSLPGRYFLLLIPAVVGGLAGAIILVKTSNLFFEQIAPFFMAAAVLLLAFQPNIHAMLYKKKAPRHGYLVALAVVIIGFILVSVYGGYFGAGFGIIALGLLGMTKLKDIQQMNGLKNLAGFTVGTADSAYFIAHHLIDWHILPLFVLGNVIGGYYAAIYSARLSSKNLRTVIIIVASVLTIYLFCKYH